MQRKISKISRRGFLAGSLAAAAVTAASPGKILGANERIRLGVIGSGNRSRSLMNNVNALGLAEWVALSDIWDERMNEAEKTAGVKVDKYADYRKLLERKDIDGVIVGTFDHAHAMITADALRAGKDVYVEKPMTSLAEQGLEVVKAARETGRIVAVGMQQRSIPHFIEAKQKFFDSGLIGEVNMVRTIWNGNGGYLFKAPPGMEKKPAGLDWEACLAWLPKIPWDPKRYFNRFAYWDFSTGGMTGGLFVHMVDVVHWFLGLEKPLSAVAQGGIYQYNDGRDTPDNINLIVKYPKVNVTFEGTVSDMASPEVADIVFMGTGGRLSIFREGYSFLTSGEKSPAAEITLKVPYGSAREHLANWLDCMRTRKKPNADAVDGHYSAMACHIGNLAYQENACIQWRKEWEV